MISSCLKVQIDNNPSFITSFTGANLDSAVSSVGNLNDLIVFSHLSNSFGGHSDWFFVKPITTITGMPSSIFMGDMLDVQSSAHPDSLSFVCFTQQTLKDSLSSQVPIVNDSPVMSQEEWHALIQSTDFADLNALFSDRYPDLAANITIVDKRTTLRVMRCTPADLLTLPATQSEAPAYVDAFDLVKAGLANNVDVLNKNGLAPAVYHADGEYIEFVADCAIQSTRFMSEPTPTLTPVY